MAKAICMARKLPPIAADDNSQREGRNRAAYFAEIMDRRMTLTLIRPVSCGSPIAEVTTLFYHLVGAAQ